MKLNELAISTFESDYLKKYLTDIKYKFTVEQIATIIINSNLALDTKIRNIDKLRNPDEIIDYVCENRGELLEQIELIKKDYEYILECCTGAYDSILTYTDEYGDTKMFTSIGALRSSLGTVPYNKNITVIIVDGSDSSDVAYLELNKNGILISYTLNKPIYESISKLYDAYIDIPNDIEVGDIVRVHGCEDEYVVVYDSKIPNNLVDKSEYSIDACITVVPKNVLDNSIEYKKQIEDIKEHRIKNIDKDENIKDIISEQHEHIHLTLIEKQEDIQNDSMQ